MKQIDYNFDLTFLDGNIIPDEEGNARKANLSLSLSLQMDGKNAVPKNIFWATELIKSGKLELDEPDIKALIKFIEATSLIPIVKERLKEPLKLTT